MRENKRSLWVEKFTELIEDFLKVLLYFINLKEESP